MWELLILLSLSAHVADHWRGPRTWSSDLIILWDPFLKDKITQRTLHDFITNEFFLNFIFWILESTSWKHFHQLLYTPSLHQRLLSWARCVEMTKTIYPEVTSKPSTRGSAQAGGTFHHTVPQVWHCVGSGYSKRDSETMSFGLCLLLQGHTVSHQMRRPLRMTQRKRSLTPLHWICPGTNVVSFGDGQENFAICLLQSPDFMKGLHLARLGSLLRPVHTFPRYTLCGLVFLWAMFFQLYREHQQPQKRAVGKQKIRDQQRQAIPFICLEDQMWNWGIMLEASKEL